MSITDKLKSVLLTYSFVISVSINLFTTGSEAAGGPPPPPPPPTPGWASQAASSNNTGSGGQTTQPGSSTSTSSRKKPSSSIKTPGAAPPTTDLGKRYAKLIDINDKKQNLIIQFPKVIAYLIRQELTLQNLDTSTDVNKIITLFNEREDSILDNAKKIYQEFIKDPYIAQFTNKNQQTGGFLDNKLFEESQEEATLRLLSLEQLDVQRKQEILSQQGDILGQLRFIKENSEILGAYGKTVSTDISKKLPKELPGILSKQGDKLKQLKFINENLKILGESSKPILKDILKKLPKKLDEISSEQLVNFILDKNKINTNLKNVTFSKKEVKELIDSLNNKILEKIFLQDDGTITEQDLTEILQKYKETDLIKNLTKAIVYIDGNTSNETVNKTLEKGLENTTPEQRGLIVDLLTHTTRIRKALITKIDREQKQNENKKLKENTEGDPLLDGLKKALTQRKSTTQETIDQKIENRKREKETKPTTGNKNVWDILKNMNNPNNQNDNQNVQDENNNGWKEDNQNAQDENNNGWKEDNQNAQDENNNGWKEDNQNAQDENNNGWKEDNQNAQDENNNGWKEDNQNAQDENNNGWKEDNQNAQDENNNGWKEDNQNAQDENNNDIDRITKANQELEQAVNAATRKFSEMNGLLKDNIIKNAATCQEYLKGAEDQLTLAREKGKELIENSAQAFKIIPKKYQGDMDENWQNYLSPEEITELNALKEKINTLENKKNKSRKFTSKADASAFKIKQEEFQTLSTTLQTDVVKKQKEQLVQNYLDEMVTNAKKSVEKIKTTLEDLKKKEKNKHDNEESIPLISKEVLEAQERIKEAEVVLSTAERRCDLAKRRRDISDSDSEDDDSDNKPDPIQAREIELNDAKEELEKAKKNLEDAKAKDQEHQRQEELEKAKKNLEDAKVKDQEHQRQEELEKAKKNLEDAKAKDQEHQRQEELEKAKKNLEDAKAKDQEHQRQEELEKAKKNLEDAKAKDQEHQRQEELEKAKKNLEDAKAKDQEHQRQEEPNRQDLEEHQQDEPNRQDLEEHQQDEPNRQDLEEHQQDEPNRQDLEEHQQDEPNRQDLEEHQQDEPNRQDLEEHQQDEPNRQDLEEHQQDEPNRQDLEEHQQDEPNRKAAEDEAIDVSPKTEEIIEQDEAAQRQQVSDDTGRKVAILVKATSTLHKPIHYHILSDRLKVAAIGAGDEEASINRGLWISGLYGINKQGAWKNITKYQSRTTGITIGADAEFINSHDVIGIAYSRLESQIKYNKKLGTTAVNGHLLSIYGLKELIKGFSLQAITSYGHNYINNKSKSINNIIGKYQNNYLSFESLLNYKYRTKYDLHFIPNIGFKYDYSRASNYKEYNVDIENLMIQKKSNQLFESSLGGKIVFKPIATTSNIVLTPSLYGNIERHFNNKNTKVNAKATFKGQILQETIIIPKQPKLGYNIGSNILVSRKNINVLFEYNYYTHKKYQSHQGLIKLKVNL